MDTFQQILAAARGLPEVDRRRLVAEVEEHPSKPNRETLRGFAIGPWLERALAHQSDAGTDTATGYDYDAADAGKRRDDS